MDGHKMVRAICTRSVTVSNVNDSGSGSLREALSNAVDYDTITIDPALAGQTINLTSRLPEINKNLTIEGNEITLSGSGITPTDYNSQIMYMIGGEVTIRRVHFKDGTANDGGGAICSFIGTLNLESCIFSGNRTTDTYASGGAIYNEGTLSVSGCTFYGNTSGYYGAICNFGMLTLTGNLFYGNTVSFSYNVVYNTGTVNSGGYNVSDYVSGDNSITGSGWTFTNGDTQVTNITFNTAFKPTSATNLKIITPTLPAGFPATYFDGTPRTIPATAGAMAQ
jgi:hypothetical protein